MPRPGSLVDLTLKDLTREWDFHSQYDQYYLATIPVRYKELLLRYIAVFSPHGIDRSGLETLFLNETEVEDATGAEDFFRLDCSSSIGRSLPLKDLKHFFITAPPPPTSTVPVPATDDAAVPDAWDTPLPPTLNLPRFHTLTHLSLSHPPGTISWSTLLHTLLPHLPTTLSHLSLAHWPPPTLTPNALTAYTTTPHTGAIQAGGTSLYSAYDGDWSEATSILRRVARLTGGLRWVSLEGCWPWMRALEGFDWQGGQWGMLEVLVVGQGWVPSCFLREGGKEGLGWRDVFVYGFAAGGGRVRERTELVDWAGVEARGLEFEKVVRGRVGDAVNGLRVVGDEDVDDDGGENVVNDDIVDNDDWTSAGLSESRRRRSTRSMTARRQGIRFERGWDAAWIREAVIEIDEQERRLRGTR